jgi:hypothetical protein
MFLRNVGERTEVCTAQQPRRPQSNYSGFKIKAVHFSEMLYNQKTRRRKNPENHNLYDNETSGYIKDG